VDRWGCSGRSEASLKCGRSGLSCLTRAEQTREGSRTRRELSEGCLRSPGSSRVTDSFPATPCLILFNLCKVVSDDFEEKSVIRENGYGVARDKHQLTSRVTLWLVFIYGV